MLFFSSRRSIYEVCTRLFFNLIILLKTTKAHPASRASTSSSMYHIAQHGTAQRSQPCTKQGSTYYVRIGVRQRKQADVFSFLFLIWSFFLSFQLYFFAFRFSLFFFAFPLHVPFFTRFFRSSFFFSTLFGFYFDFRSICPFFFFFLPKLFLLVFSPKFFRFCGPFFIPGYIRVHRSRRLFLNLLLLLKSLRIPSSDDL